MSEIMTVIFRTLVVYFVVLLIIRLMGKREIGELSPFDFVVAVIIADLASIPVEDNSISLIQGLIPVFLLGILEIALSFISLKSKKIRNIAYGRPQLIIQNGRIIYREMKKARYNLDDLLEQLREAGYANVSDVEFGILETSGSFTVIPKVSKRPLCAADIGLTLKEEKLPVNLIMDGVVQQKNLTEFGIDRAWLNKQLAEQKIELNNILLASLDNQGNLFINKKNN